MHACMPGDARLLDSVTASPFVYAPPGRGPVLPPAIPYAAASPRIQVPATVETTAPLPPSRLSFYMIDPSINHVYFSALPISTSSAHHTARQKNEEEKRNGQTPIYAALGFLVPYLLRLVMRLPTPPRSSAPRTRWYFTPGQSWERPPRTRTTLCCWTLWPGLLGVLAFVRSIIYITCSSVRSWCLVLTLGKPLFRPSCLLLLLLCFSQNRKG